MDWSKLEKNIRSFAKTHNMGLSEFDTTYVGGQVSTYQLQEDSKIYYELKHTKPRVDHGSLLRVYSKSDNHLSINAKAKLFGNPSLKTNNEISLNLERQLKNLCKEIGSFKWISESHHLGWPEELLNSKILKFECKRIDLAFEQLEEIREIHFMLVSISSAVAD